MKTCEAFADLLDLYVDGELSPEEADKVRAHLDTCSDCRAYVEDILFIRAGFPSADETELPAGFADSVMAAIQSAPAAAKPKRRQSAAWAKVLLPLAACFAVVIALNPFSPSVPPMKQEIAAPRSENVVPYTETKPQEAGDSIPEAADADVPASSKSAASPKDTVSPEVPAVVSKELPEQETPSTFGYDDRRLEPYIAQMLLTQEQAGDLLADFTPLRETDTQIDYEIPLKDYDAIYAALEEQGITPSFHSSKDSLREHADPDTALTLISVLN